MSDFRMPYEGYRCHPWSQFYPMEESLRSLWFKVGIIHWFWLHVLVLTQAWSTTFGNELKFRYTQTKKSRVVVLRPSPFSWAILQWIFCLTNYFSISELIHLWPISLSCSNFTPPRIPSICQSTVAYSYLSLRLSRMDLPESENKRPSRSAESVLARVKILWISTQMRIKFREPQPVMEIRNKCTVYFRHPHKQSPTLTKRWPLIELWRVDRRSEARRVTCIYYTGVIVSNN